MSLVLKGQIKHGAAGRFLAFFDPKCDEDARVHPGQNVFLRYPPVKKGRLVEFATAVDTVMQAAQDLVIIFEGRVKDNRDVIEEVIKDMKWPARDMTHPSVQQRVL